MTPMEAYETLYGWAHSVLGESVAVIMAWQNAPQQKTPQVAIAIPDLTPFGTSTKPNPVYNEADEIWEQRVVTDYEGESRLWETGAHGEHLQALVNSLDQDEWIAYFAQAGMAVSANGTIQWLPRLNDKSYIQEATTALSIRLTSESTQTLGALVQPVITRTT